MKERTRLLLDKAQDAIETAELLHGAGKAPHAVGKAYYAMFYTAEALLYERGFKFRKHSGVHAAYGLHFAKTGVLDPKFHQWILAAFELRIGADYGFEATVESPEAESRIEQAREFHQAVRDHLA